MSMLGVSGIHTVCNFLSLCLRHVTLKRLNVFVVALENVDDIGIFFLFHNELHNDSNKSQKEFNQNVN